MTLELDVGIVGGGLAGNLLARQLRRRLPELRVGLFEKASETDYKVGEATVEISASYLVRRQGLTGYLYENHLPKNGLRYFFDSPERDAPLEEMSEMGTVNLPFHPAFQLDRARLEADLLEMNRRDGIHLRRGARVHDLSLGRDGAPHHFQVSDAGGTTPVRARWLVDAAGRTGLVARLEDLRVREEEHRIGSVWGRFENVVDIDQVGSEAWRGRVRHTARRLSTLHFWYPGYWFWFIPLRGGVTSIGVTGDVVRQRRELRTLEGFRAFAGEHAAIGSLLEGAKPIDLGGFENIAYGTKRFFHPDRWGLTGESATAADPLYSPGLDFIALENDFLTDLVVRDRAGEDLSERIGLYDGFMQFRHAAAMLLYRGLYGTCGSYELARLKWDFDIGCYYNLWVSSYLCDEHLDATWLRRQLRMQDFVLNALRGFAGLFRQVETSLHERGLYFRENLGHFYYGLTNIDFAEEVGLPRTRRDVLEKCGEIFNRARAEALALMGRVEKPEAVEPLPLTAFLTGQPLDAVD